MANEDDDDLVTAATQIGGGLADALAGPASSFAFGQMLNVIGLGDNTGPVSTRLNQIIAQINQLQQTLDAFITAMSAAIAQVNYDVVAAPIEPLLNTNTTLAPLFQQLAEVDTSDATAIATAKAAVNEVLTSAIVLAPATWNSALCGSAGSTGVLEAWHRVARTHYQNFGPAASNSIQQHWDYLDAQQALSVMYAVEYYNSQSNATAAAAVISTWHANRQTQLGLIRGGTRHFDYSKWTDPVTKISSIEQGASPSLPSGCMVIMLDGAPLMCDTQVYGPISRGDNDDLSDFDAAMYPYTVDVNDTTIVGVMGDYTSVDKGGWNPPPIPLMIDMLNYFGGSVGGSGADEFAAALQASEFVFPDGPIRLWTDVTRGADDRPLTNGMQTRSVFVDGDSWWNPSTNADDSAMLLYVRRLFPAEIDTYWYPLT